MALLKLDKVTKFFGDFKAVDNVSLDIERGEFFVLLGKSGSGKTTVLRLIAGLEKVSSGKIFIDGEDVTDLPPNKRDVGMVFQNYALYPNKTVRENLLVPLENSKMSKEEKEALIQDIAKNLEILQLLDRYPSQLSGGQQQRVAIAKALVKRPKVMLMDEPLSNLDAQLRLSARRFIKKVQREYNITTVYVTHDQSEALAMADRIGVIDKGMLLQVGEPEDVYYNPINERVASIVGNPPMSFINIDGKKVGVRPEDVILGDGPYKALVSDCEFWGSYYLVYLDYNGSELKAFSSKRVKEGSDINFRIVSYREF